MLLNGDILFYIYVCVAYVVCISDAYRMKKHLTRPLSQGRPKGIKTHDALAAQAFGLTVRKKRLSIGVSQEALADLSGLARTHVGRLERGEMTPLITVAFKISKGLGVRSGELMDEAEKLYKRMKRMEDKNKAL